MKINGIDIPAPSSIEFQLEHIDEAERNSLGNMLIDGVNVKQRLQFSWKYLSVAQAQTIFEQVSSVTQRIVEIEDYPSPLTGNLESGNFYTGGKQAGSMQILNGNAIGYRDITFNAIEV